MVEKDYFEDMYNIDPHELNVVHMCFFSDTQRFNYFKGEPVRRTDVQGRVGKAASKDEVKGEMIKVG